MSDTYTVWLCQCCMIAAVNGEPCQCCYGVEEHQGCDEHPAGLLGKLEGEHITPGILFEQHDQACPVHQHGGECYGCETRTFSWSPCDGCGSTLGGERHAFTGWIS